MCNSLAAIFLLLATKQEKLLFSMTYLQENSVYIPPYRLVIRFNIVTNCRLQNNTTVTRNFFKGHWYCKRNGTE